MLFAVFIVLLIGVIVRAVLPLGDIREPRSQNWSSSLSLVGVVSISARFKLKRDMPSIRSARASSGHRRFRA
jgi:hypothetical protein